MRVRNLCIAAVLAIAALIFTLTETAYAAEYMTEGTIKLGHTEKAANMYEDQYMAFTTVFKEAVERNTGGRFKVTVFPNGQLGDNRSMMEQCQRGLLHMQISLANAYLSVYDQRMALFELPYVFRNGDHIARMFKTSYGKEMIETLAQKNGIRILDVLTAGMRCFSNNVRNVASPSDMKGLKIRSMEIPIYMKMTEALGASPTPIPWSELYTSCQTGVVDGQENAPQSIVLAGLHEVQKYLTLDNHTVNTIPIIINEKFYQSLSPDDQFILKAAASEAIKAFQGVLALKESREMSLLNERMEITPLSNTQIEEFKKVALPPCLDYMTAEVGQEEVEKFLNAAKESEEY